jgi:hypothetical protein
MSFSLRLSVAPLRLPVWLSTNNKYPICCSWRGEQMQCTDKQQKTVCGPTEKSRTTAQNKPYQALGGSMSEISTKVSPSLHPDTVKALPDYDDDTLPVLAPTVTAFDTAYQAVIAVHTAREAAKTNPTWNEAQQVIQTDDLARRKLEHVTKTFDSVRSNLVKGIEHIEAELTAPVTAKAAVTVATEIRAFVRDMDTAKRHQFIQDAMDNGDETTVSSLLGAPAYLSGLNAEFQQTYTRMWREKTAPGMAKRLRAMTAAKEMIERNAPIVFSSMEKAVGAPPHKAKALREAKTAAEKHFVMGSA